MKTMIEKESISCLDMRIIPAGEFLMGSNDPDAGPFEQPVHPVWLDDFAIASTPVTNLQFEMFQRETGYPTTSERAAAPSHPSCEISWRDFSGGGRSHHPVVCVSWIDANAFCKWLTSETGNVYRLPTEAEWEKAARGGLEQKIYPWGSDEPHGKACWNRSRLPMGTMPVASFEANDYGLFDMAGNVWEWCFDWYDDHFYWKCKEDGKVKNPAGPRTGEFRTRRGASWNVEEPFRMRCSNRGALPPSNFWPNLGFRCAMPLK